MRMINNLNILLFGVWIAFELLLVTSFTCVINPSVLNRITHYSKGPLRRIQLLIHTVPLTHLGHLHFVESWSTPFLHFLQEVEPRIWQRLQMLSYLLVTICRLNSKVRQAFLHLGKFRGLRKNLEELLYQRNLNPLIQNRKHL